MGSSCSSAQKKKEKNKGGLTVPDEQRRQSVLSTDSLPYGKGSPPSDRKKSDAAARKRSSGGAAVNNATGGATIEETPPANQGAHVTSDYNASSSPSGITVTPNSANLGDGGGTPRFRTAASPEAQGLPNLQQFPDSVLDLLMGKVRDAAVATSVKEISIYICAGYKDTEVEREALTEMVFPDLRLHCANRGYELRLVDLHWGHIGPYLDEHGYRFICLNTLQELKDRGALLILLLLNDGSEQLTLPPRRVNASDMEQALLTLSSSGEGDDGDDDEGRVSLLKWYGRDDNAVPSSGDSEPVFVLRPIRNHLPNIVSNFEDERQEARETWAAESRLLVTTLKKVFSEEQRALYFSSVLEDEISKFVLDDPKMSKRCLWFQRTFTHLGVAHPTPSVDEEDPPEGGATAADNSATAIATSVLDQVDANRVSLMKVRLQEQLPDNQKIVFKVKWRKSNRVFPEEFDDHQQYLRELCGRAGQELKKLIDGMIEEDFLEEAKQTYRGIEASLYDELLRQTTFCKIGAAVFFHQEELLETLKNYVTGDNPNPLVIHAPQGRGKTALLSTVATRCCDWVTDTPVVFRLVGATPDSMTQEQLLRSVCEQCCALYGEHPSAAFKNWDDSEEEPLQLLLSKVNSRRPLVLLIDGLDRIAPYSSRDLRWLPAKLPPHVKLILTVRDDTEELKALKDLLQSEECFVSIPSLGPQKYLDLVDNIVQRNQRSLTEAHREIVLKCLQIATPTPRYAYLIGHRVLDWWSDEEPDLSTIPSTTPEMVHETMAYLEGHLGVEVAAYIVGFLAASRYGLTEAEMLDLLTLQEPVLERALAHDPQCKLRRCPYMVWGVAKRRMKPLLRSTTVGKRTLVTWRCDAYRTLCQKRVGEDTWEACLRGLAAYFEGDTGEAKGLVLEQPTRFGSWPNRRKADELPFCYFQMGDSLSDRFALDLNWLKLKVTATDPYCLLEDVEMCRRQLDADDEEEIKELELLTAAITKASYALRYDGSQLTSQLYTRLKAVADKPNCAEDWPLLLKLFQLSSKPTEPTLLPVSFPESGGGVGGVGGNVGASLSVTGGDEVSFAALHTMKGNPYYLVSLATKSGQVTVWDVYREKPTRTLTGVFEPKDVQMIDDSRALVLCNRELKVYNLDAGCLVTKLKGVMNQKMAYYGLHDENYVVALSRNRMYVNMMNLRTGDLETTFKVGEDRFLNSLLVSANGRICVCGDETQKPFPLLVWDLANRKLLYDLRIPHHEFLTRMSAISHDGHYVVCVCRELDDGSPNFIIVYDLQSGTLFKKWKPESNSCSIAISSPGGCVINGLENTLVLVWDLVTGARRFNLQGHTAPVDEIKLDDEGGRCLTYDSAGRDRSVRVWDLARGECLAVLTPDLPIACAQMTLDGKAVVMALKQRTGIVTYLLCHNSCPEDGLPERQPYGDPENDGKDFDVAQQG